MLINLGEELIPASDQAALALVANKLELILGPAVLDAEEEVLQDEFTSCFSEDLTNHLLVLDEVCLPEVAEG